MIKKENKIDKKGQIDPSKTWLCIIVNNSYWVLVGSSAKIASYMHGGGPLKPRGGLCTHCTTHHSYNRGICM